MGRTRRRGVGQAARRLSGFRSCGRRSGGRRPRPRPDLRPMTRVLMTADTVGGVWTYALELADALAAHDVEVTLATMGRPLRPDQWEEVQASSVAAVHESAYALEWMPDP